MTRPRNATALPTRPPLPIKYSAMVTGDGRVLPIVETLGRRVLSEIDAFSSRGRRLLAEGLVTLWYEDGRSVETGPIREVLDKLLLRTKLRRDAWAGAPGWGPHHDRVLRSIGRMKRIMKP